MSWLSDIKLCLSSLSRRVTIIEEGGVGPGGDVDFASPPPIGNVAPNTGKFTTLQATSGITGNVTGNVSGSAASFTGSLVGDVTGTQGATVISAATVTGKALTGYVSAAGVLSASDSILTAINKLNGNDGLKAPLANPTFTGTVTGTFSGPLTGNVTGNVSGSAASFTGPLLGDVTGTQATTAISAATVTGKAITGFVSGAGTVTSSDSILTAFNKINGNVALKANTSSLGTLATLSPTGTPSSTTYLRGDNTWATVTGSGGLSGTGAVDNAILRADGTGGSTLQSSKVTIDDLGQITWPTVLGAITHILGPADQSLKMESPSISSGSAARSIYITAGTVNNTPGNTVNVGGSVSVSGGDGNTGGDVVLSSGVATNLSGGRSTITLKGATSIAAQGYIAITGAQGTYQIIPGSIFITGGPSGQTPQNGGNVTVTSGAAASSYVSSNTTSSGQTTISTNAGGNVSGPYTSATAGSAGTLNIIGGSGGNAVGTVNGVHTGGIGAAVVIKSGTGGTANPASITGTLTGGNSGALTLGTGAGGAGTTTQGNSGDITLATGAGLSPGSIVTTIAGVEKFRIANAKISAAVPLGLASYTVGTAPTPTTNAGALIYVTDDIGGAVPAFSDATNWRRVTDRAVVAVA